MHLNFSFDAQTNQFDTRSPISTNGTIWGGRAGWEKTSANVNEYIIESHTKYPSRIIPFCSVNPNWGDYAIDQILEYLPYGMAGIGELHPSSQQFELEDPQIASFWNTLIENNLPLLLHTSEPVGHVYPGKGNISLSKITDFISDNAQLEIICAHWGGGHILFLTEHYH